MEVESSQAFRWRETIIDKLVEKIGLNSWVVHNLAHDEECKILLRIHQVSTEVDRIDRSHIRVVYTAILGSLDKERYTQLFCNAGYSKVIEEIDPDGHVFYFPHKSTQSDEFLSITDNKKGSTAICAERFLYEEEWQTDAGNCSLVWSSDTISVRPMDVKKSTAILDDSNSAIKHYPHCGSKTKRIALIFNWSSFNFLDTARIGSETDVANLKQLFENLNFKTITIQNINKRNFDSFLLNGLSDVVKGAKCLVTVLCSHGYPLQGSDVVIRLAQGELMSVYEILEHFNNHNLPELINVPKVFVFQFCRGNKVFEVTRKPPSGGGDAACNAQSAASDIVRPYSDMLIAYSTIPGYKAARHLKDGSYFIQAICDVFAEHAYRYHIEDLFKLVDSHVAKHVHQTTSVVSWGFDKHLYLYPGILNNIAPNPAALDEMDHDI